MGKLFQIATDPLGQRRSRSWRIRLQEGRPG